ncbi:MAG: glycoside hydrolase family 3 protein [Notoacmeibacter sp.]|nr:glycoside hydrolase family 3 protein [Notoacmeibacter sp.]MCC0031954.1 glycoside hydrolase family 3 protein [Brucellaceae bacterium]
MRPLIMALALLAAGPAVAGNGEPVAAPAAGVKLAQDDGKPVASDPQLRIEQAFSKAPGTSIEQKIGQMVLIGFNGDTVDNKAFKRTRAQLEKGEITGVIYLKRNIRNAASVKAMNAELQIAAGDLPPLISIDQEGGRIERLTSAVGFPETPSAARMAASVDPRGALEAYGRMAANLKAWGFNLNFGPVVDLNVNASNPIIGKLGRSYSADPAKVADYASAFVNGHRQHRVLTALKHFPGHGSSTRDSHKGAVDVTASWTPQELEPFRSLIRGKDADLVMSGHVHNGQLQAKGDKAPMSLSPALARSLRGDLKFNGVIITDDMQMDAVHGAYSLANAVLRAVKAGNDIMIFANDKHADPDIPGKVALILKEAAAKDPAVRRAIDASYARIVRMKNWLLTTNSIAASARVNPDTQALRDLSASTRAVLSAELMQANRRDVRLALPGGVLF